MLPVPAADGVQEHVATELVSATAEQPVITLPPNLNATVPVVPEVTVAVSEYVLLARGDAGMFPRVTVELAHVAVCVADVLGRLVVPESTGVTRTSYCVASVRPVMMAVVIVALAVWLHVVQVESVDFLYSTVKSVMPVVSPGKLHDAVSRSV